MVKRGYAHAHLLLTLCEEDKFNNPADIDSAVWAEIPDPNEFPLMYKTVTKTMIHGPYGQDNARAVCMQNGQCSKGFPFDFRSETIIDAQGCLKY